MKKILLTIVAGALIASCSGENENFKNTDALLRNHRGEALHFPAAFKNNVVLVSYIYTHCPDICPMTTNNLKRVAEKLGACDNVKFALITFDPQRDSADVLKSYAIAYGLENNPNWTFLTGEEKQIDEVMKNLSVVSKRSFTQQTDSATNAYFIAHTDKITLLDKQGNIFKTYSGSDADIDEIAEDVRKLVR